jgi:pyrroline-5-carboxylate reductase
MVMSTSNPTAKPPTNLESPPGAILLVGAGKMGSALLEGWIRRGFDPGNLIVLEPQPEPRIAALTSRGLKLNPSPAPATSVAAIVLAIKPQLAPEVVPRLASYVGSGTVVVSIMAGRTIRFIEDALRHRTSIVRAMPNTPAGIGRGITVAVPNAEVSQRQRALVDDLLSAVGAVEWIGDEALMDAVTAVSGSGPAYVFLLAEALARAGSAAGLPDELAEKLARATVSGSGELLHRSTLHPQTLRQNVTSPGGTTAAAVAILMAEDGLMRLMKKAVLAAARRSRELAG